MIEQIKIDFEKIIKSSAFSEKDVELKKMHLNKFLETGFPSRKLENWKFSDLNQIIKKNIGELSFLGAGCVIVDGLNLPKNSFIKANKLIKK